MSQRRLIALALLAILLLVTVVAAVVGVRWWRGGPTTDLERAASYAPPDAQRLSWTDWAGIRAEVGADDLSGLLDAGFDADLTSTSALVGSAPLLEDGFGFSPATVEWELFSQSDSGAAVVVRLPDDADFDAIGARLEDSGFDEPAEDDGVWTGGVDLLPEIGSGLTPELQYVALVPDEHLALTSDDERYLRETVDDLGDGDLPGPVADVIAASGDALSAAVYTGAHTCKALAMSQADPSDQQQAEQLVAAAGEVDPVSGFAMSVQPGGDVRVVLAFEGEDQARANADSRSVLASGPAPGQGGDFADRFTVGSVTADGKVVTMRLRPAAGAFVLSDLSSGPVLFATC